MMWLLEARAPALPSTANRPLDICYADNAVYTYITFYTNIWPDLPIEHVGNSRIKSDQPVCRHQGNTPEK
jgi:hypothetical protein